MALRVCSSQICQGAASSSLPALRQELAGHHPVFEHHIHPDIGTDDTNMRIADVGTGTACNVLGNKYTSSIWLTDLAHKLPEFVRLDGFDVSFDAAPLREWLPPNMTLQYWDIKKEVPEHLVGAYDLVNIRFFAVVLLASEIKHVLNNLSRLLSACPLFYPYSANDQSTIVKPSAIEPGGFLQWTDAEFSSLRTGRPAYTEQAIYEDLFLALDSSIRSKKIDEKTVQERRATIRDAAKASREGSYLAYTYYRVIGRKAVGSV
ncbi:hypothetical protein ASPBRDRAFT_34279 [Aspergillus brasiliensis CBS 101740]|uniref:Methyltransferase domain-containing protein n=1 Tax=Aspergillus brasiliensis (strain CBS 101740 / IMI 381727 / IBT 21946) TaxID=767769 RepID=A0A1L9U6Z6_ASPBC|nr:hypothetical protein ASPBRDRAFT_34279 [Aspergillus brasiliensis CBS 101740]